MTAQELFEYSHEPFRTELVAGKLFEMEPAGALHGAVAARVCEVLSSHVRAHGLGVVFGAETGFHLESEPDTVRAPDAGFVSSERSPRPASRTSSSRTARRRVRGHIAARPARRGREQDALVARPAGTRAVVVIDPRRRTATIHRAGVAPALLDDTTRSISTTCYPASRPAVGELLH